jgi:hypothetical protein
LKGHHFGIQKSITNELKGIPTEAFQHCYKQWKQCLRRCVAAQGNYFQGINLVLQKRIKFMVKRKPVSLLFCHTLLRVSILKLSIFFTHSYAAFAECIDSDCK